MNPKYCCCCCRAYLSPCHQTASDANWLDDLHTFYCNDCFVIGGIRTCLEVSDDSIFLWISSYSCPLNLLLVWSHQAEVIVVKRLVRGRNSGTRMRVEPRSRVVKTTPWPIRPRYSKTLAKFKYNYQRYCFKILCYDVTSKECLHVQIKNGREFNTILSTVIYI